MFVFFLIYFHEYRVIKNEFRTSFSIMVYRAFRSCCSFFFFFCAVRAQVLSRRKKEAGVSLSHLLIETNVSPFKQSAIAMGRYVRSDLSRVTAVRHPGRLKDTISRLNG